MELKEAVLTHLDAKQTGSILIRCEGGYVARFTLSYKLNGKEFSKHSGNISLGVNKSETIPEGATSIYLKVEENWAFGWSTIFTKSYDKPVTECYKVYGTTLDPKYSKISC
ncbi:hypothetical protein [Aquimarina sp. Aq107]|uniref:hypothetical protein n=1 Tax=unclassified Aquimarina TaxID=2627091 RepID=UPI000D560253|nr:hypothetical protein [Aquimarina sp. Aq107]